MKAILDQTLELRKMASELCKEYAVIRAERLNLAPEKLPEFIRLTAQHWWAGNSHETALQMAAKEVMA